MELIPVIDLKGGHVVHARGGTRSDYQPIATPLARSSAPQHVVDGLLRLFPFRMLYVADLDAIEGRGNHDTALAAIARGYPQVQLWVDNGVDEPDAAFAWLAHDVGHLVMGSESQRGPELIRALCKHPRVLLSLDFRGAAFLGPREILVDATIWPTRVIVMALARVGAGGGPDLPRLADIERRAADRLVYAAGGVRSAADLWALAELGVAGALVATALHAGAIGPRELEALARS